jgi:hypothetical protein
MAFTGRRGGPTQGARADFVTCNGKRAYAIQIARGSGEDRAAASLRGGSMRRSGKRRDPGIRSLSRRNEQGRQW